MKRPASFFLFSIFAAAIMGAAAFFSPAAVHAQAIPYENLAKQNREVINKLSAGVSSPEDRTQVTKYFQNYELGRWLLRDAEVSIPDYRDELIKMLVPVLSANQESAKLAAGTILAGAKKLVSDNELSPVIKYNAVLLAGELCEARDGNVLTPYEPANDYLVQLITADAVPAYLKVAALNGLRLHAGRNLAAAKKQALVPIFAKYAFVDWKAGEPAEVTWMREVGIEGLGVLRAAGPGGDYTDKLVAIIANEQPGYPMEMRLAAATAVSRFTHPSGKKKPLEIYEAVAKFTVEAITREYKREWKLQRGVLPGQKVKKTAYDSVLTLTPEQEMTLIRSLRQRVMAIAEPMSVALYVNPSSPNATPLGKSLSTTEQEWARQVMTGLQKLCTSMERVGAKPKRPVAESATGGRVAVEIPKFSAVREELAETLAPLYRTLKLNPANLKLPSASGK